MQAKTFTRVALIAWVMQALIVVSGAAVRLTDAGLGCEDWPTCNEGKLFPEWQLHGLIEFGNRVISGFVAVSAVAVLVAAYRLPSRRPDLLRYAWLVVAGTLTQVVLGGITVLLDLNPVVVSVHFLLSMGLLAAAQYLWFHSRSDSENSRIAGSGPDASHPQAGMIRGQLGLATIVLLTGTVVTGTGPNSGDTEADRLNFELEAVTRIHSIAVWLLVAALVLLAVRLSRNPAPAAPRPGVPAPFSVVRWMLAAAVVQGGIGYTQFALGVPPLLVELHIVGAITIWSLALLLVLSVSHSSDKAAGTPSELPEWEHGFAS